ncbi:MAG: hypothetical protein ACTSXF_12810, partial [Promethearchaeota archaeon]
SNNILGMSNINNDFPNFKLFISMFEGISKYLKDQKVLITKHKLKEKSKIFKTLKSIKYFKE